MTHEETERERMARILSKSLGRDLTTRLNQMQYAKSEDFSTIIDRISNSISSYVKNPSNPTTPKDAFWRNYIRNIVTDVNEILRGIEVPYRTAINEAGTDETKLAKIIIDYNNSHLEQIYTWLKATETAIHFNANHIFCHANDALANYGVHIESKGKIKAPIQSYIGRIAIVRSLYYYIHETDQKKGEVIIFA